MMGMNHQLNVAEAMTEEGLHFLKKDERETHFS